MHTISDKKKTIVVIAVDGPTAAGKGTLARQLARHLQFAYLDTGLLYRAVAAKALEHHLDWDNKENPKLVSLAKNLTEVDLQSPSLREEKVGQTASIMATFPAIRAALWAFQRNFPELATVGNQSLQGAILDGRDIGTVIWPEAQVKLFVTALQEVRANRRYKELLNRGQQVIYAQVLQDIQERDNRDQKRLHAPLAPAADAFIIDNSDLNAEQAFQVALGYVQQRLADHH